MGGTLGQGSAWAIQGHTWPHGSTLIHMVVEEMEKGSTLLAPQLFPASSTLTTSQRSQDTLRWAESTYKGRVCGYVGRSYESPWPSMAQW